jgi:glycosyltransferase involved in cell wall biosynthesis
MIPSLSVIIPVCNRAALVSRAIQACLRQTFSNFELILVDDGSNDGTAEALERHRLTDSRIRVLKHDRNRGASPARNTGVQAARAEWLIFADSDDELLPSALETVAKRLRDVSDDVGRLVFMYRVDGGGFSPEPPLVEEVWDYPGYLRWVDLLRGRSDVVNCIRRSTFRTIRFAEDRTFESHYCHDFAKMFKTASFPEVLGIVHLDAANRNSNPTVAQLLQMAPDNARARAGLLAQHGEAIRAVSPLRYRAECRLAAFYCFLAGERREGFRFLRPLLREGAKTDIIVLCALGMTHRRLLALAMVAKSRIAG